MLLLLMNVGILPRCRYTASEEVQIADTAWKVTDHGKDDVVVSDILSSSANDGARVRDEKLHCSSSKIPRLMC